MVNKAKLDQMLSNLRGFLGVLKTLGAVPRDRFLKDADKIGNAKYHFVISIECCIDVANHVIASENYRFPRDNADGFVVLVEQGVLDESLREPLRAMAKLRNRLVHLYWDVDDGAVHDYLQRSLQDMERFARAVASREW
jgi:uncharacterized protein YutE (UPF0331/DUF86 family)